MKSEAPAPKVLIDLPYCRFLYRGCANTIVAFSAIGCPEGKFHGSNALVGTDSNLLLVNCPRNSWYLDGIPGLGDSPESAAEGIAGILATHGLSCRNAIAWGGSMGGYGAVVLGSMMGAGRIVATGAELALLVAGGNSELILKNIQKRMIVDSPDVRNIVASAGSPVWLYAGEFFYPDLVSAKLVMDLPNVRVTTLRDFGHPLPAYIHQRYGLDRFILSHDRIARAFAFEDREIGNLAAWSSHWETLHRASTGDPEAAACLSGVSRGGDVEWTAHCHHALSLGASAAGDSAAALEQAGQALRLRPESPFLIERLARALRAAGAPADEWLATACSIPSLNRPELFENAEKLLDVIADGFIESDLRQKGSRFFKEQMLRPDTRDVMKARFRELMHRVQGCQGWSVAFASELERDLLGKLIDNRQIASNRGNSWLSGVMLFDESVGQPVDFEAEGIELVNWDCRIASPGFGRLHAGHPAAASARFRFSVRFGQSDTAVIHALWPDGRRSPALVFRRRAAVEETG